MNISKNYLKFLALTFVTVTLLVVTHFAVSYATQNNNITYNPDYGYTPPSDLKTADENKVVDIPD